MAFKDIALALTCTVLSACTILETSDTVVSTDVGEKIIVKDSAVEVDPWAPRGEAIRKEITDSIAAGLEGEKRVCKPPLEIRGRFFTSDGVRYSDLEFGPNSGACKMTRDGIASSRKTLKVFDNVMKKSDKAKRVTYREIRQDLNGKRVADDSYKVITCLDSSLPEDLRAKFSEFDSDVPKQSNDLAGLANDQLVAKLCKKHGARP